MGWHYNENGIYTVKSGYWVGTHLPTVAPPQPIHGSLLLKKQIWKTKVPMKLKHFLWRLLTKSLALGSNLRRRHVTRFDQCRHCCSAEETEEHIFFDCPYAKSIWRASGVSNTIINSSTSSLEEKIEACLQCSLSARLEHIQDYPIWILWRLWKSRNMVMFQNKSTHRYTLLRYARADADEWKQYGRNIQNGFTSNGNSTQVDSESRWRRPPEGWIKCNTDGSFIHLQQPSTA